MPKISMAIAFNQELSRLLPMVSDITIIEYEGNDITCSVDLFQYMSQSGITPSAQRFINDEDKRFGLNAFTFEQDKDAEINAYFDNILQEKSADPSNKRDVKNIGKGIVIDEYNVVNNNCVTTTLNAIQAKTPIKSSVSFSLRALISERYHSKS